LQPHKDLAPTAINHCPLLDARAGDHCRRYAIMMVPKQKQSNQWQDESAMATAAPSHLNGSWARMPLNLPLLPHGLNEYEVVIESE